MAIAGISLQNDLQRVETISQNLANVLTPGYKRQVLLGASFASQMAQVSSRHSLDLHNSSQQAASITLDPSPGVMRYSGKALDIVPEDNSFFEVATKNGPAYTRQGSLQLDLQGRLIGAGGYPVMGVGGEIKLTNTPFTIATNGDVIQAERVAGRIKLVQFDNPADLLPLGAGMYEQGSARLALAPSRGALKIGFQENSNVNSAQEMVRLSEAVRHFEAMSRVVQAYDDSLEKAIRKLGEF